METTRSILTLAETIVENAARAMNLGIRKISYFNLIDMAYAPVTSLEDRPLTTAARSNPN